MNRFVSLPASLVHFLPSALGARCGLVVLSGIVLAAAVVGCGDTESDAPASATGGSGGATNGSGGSANGGDLTPVVDSGLPKDKTIAELTPEQLTTVCKAVVQELPPPNELCVIGSLGTLLDPTSGGGITEEACTQALEACKGSGAAAGGFGEALSGLSGQACELAGAGGGVGECTATVREVEECASGLLTLAKVVPTLDCKTLATPAGRTQLLLIAAVSGAASCRELPEKCPGSGDGTGPGGVGGRGGASAGGTSAGGTSAGGTSAGGTSAGGTGTGSGGTSAGGTSAGGVAGSAGGPF